MSCTTGYLCTLEAYECGQGTLEVDYVYAEMLLNNIYVLAIYIRDGHEVLDLWAAGPWALGRTEW